MPEVSLEHMGYAQLTRFLAAHSGLPGPRANLSLMKQAAASLPDETLERLVTENDEYLRCCGVRGLGERIIRSPEEERASLISQLTAETHHDSWRVREAAAMAGQRIGDADPPQLRELVRKWLSDSGDPLQLRAAIATICEPRLLVDKSTAALALDACDMAGAALVANDQETRRSRPWRVLRQALGYCWSVAIAAEPENGLQRFAELEANPDKDLSWIVRQNRRKRRLRALRETG